MTISPYYVTSLNLSSVLPQSSPVPPDIIFHSMGHPAHACGKAPSLAWILTTRGLVIQGTDLPAGQTQVWVLPHHGLAGPLWQSHKTSALGFPQIGLIPSPALLHDFGGRWLLSYSLHLWSRAEPPGLLRSCV